MRQFLRKCNLIVAGDSGDGLDLSNLRIQFAIKKADSQTPNKGNIRVYNLAENTSQRIQKEFTQIVLEGGYEENSALIFKGNVKQVSRGTERGTDTFLDIACGDGDEAYNFSVVNTTLAAGATQADQLQAAQSEFAKKGVTQGSIEGLKTESLPRGKVMYGMARNYMRDIAKTSKTSWSIQDGVLQVVPYRGLLPDQVVILNSKTGLIGTPEQTDEGIKAQCLLNPLIRIGGRVQIDEQNIVTQKVTDTTGKEPVNEPAKITKDGIYRVLTVEHTGDTRGNEWFTNITCLSVDATAPTNESVQGT
jgi:hypothetical protein